MGLGQWCSKNPDENFPPPLTIKVRQCFRHSAGKLPSVKLKHSYAYIHIHTPTSNQTRLHPRRSRLNSRRPSDDDSSDDEQGSFAPMSRPSPFALFARRASTLLARQHTRRGKDEAQSVTRRAPRHTVLMRARTHKISTPHRSSDILRSQCGCGCVALITRPLIFSPYDYTI